MENQLKFAFLQINEESPLQINFSEDDADELVEEYKFIEFTRTSGSNKEQHILFPPFSCAIKYIKWEI